MYQKTLLNTMKMEQDSFKRQTKKLSFEFPSTFYLFDELKQDNINKITLPNVQSDKE